jgi:hypothetical protein
MSDFMEKMVALANGVHSDLVALPDNRARYELVKQIIDSAEVVFAVWTDRFAQAGVGRMLVKGAGHCASGRCRQQDSGFDPRGSHPLQQRRAG